MKTRIKLRFFKEGTKVKQSYVVELMYGGRWGAVADDSGIKKFATRELAEAEADSLNHSVAEEGREP